MTPGSRTRASSIGAKNRRTIGQIVRGLLLFWEVCEPDEMVDRLEYL